MTIEEITEIEIAAWKSACADKFLAAGCNQQISTDLADLCWDNAITENDGNITAAALSDPAQAAQDEMDYWEA